MYTSNLADLARHLLANGPRKTHPTSRRVRALLHKTFIVDTTKATHVWEHDHYPQYYFPLSQLQNCEYRDTETIQRNGQLVAAVVELTVSPGEKKCDRVIRFVDDANAVGALAGLVRLEFGSMDQWLEEDTPIYVHPKDPFKRVETLTSTRPIEIRIAETGTTVAKSPWAVHLLETGLPTRYYLPLSAVVDQGSLRNSNLVTKCPYKGEAEYYHIVLDNGDQEGKGSVTVMENLVWYYRLPTHESAAIAGLICFYNEKVDIYLDGDLQERPKTHFA